MTNQKETLILNLKHFHSEEECEDKSRYTAFLEYIENNINIKTFEECEGFSHIKVGLKNQNEFIQFTSQKILGHFLKDEKMFLKYIDLLKMLKNDTDVVKEAFLYVLLCCSNHSSGRKWVFEQKFENLIISSAINPNQYIRKVSVQLVKNFGITNFDGCEKSEFILELIEELEEKDKYENILKSFYNRDVINILKKVKDISKFEDYLKSIFDKDVHLFLYTVKNLSVNSMNNYFKDKVLSLISDQKLQPKCLLALSNLPFDKEYFKLVSSIIRESKFNTQIILAALDIFNKQKDAPKDFEQLLFEILSLNNYQTFKKTFLILKNMNLVDEKVIIGNLTHFNEEIQYFILEFLYEFKEYITKDINQVIQDMIKNNMHPDIIFKFLSQIDLLNILPHSESKIEILKLIQVTKENQKLVQKEILTLFYEEGIQALYDMILSNEKNFESEFLETINIRKDEEQEEILYFFIENDHLECE